MTTKDTKAEEDQDEEFYDDYNENDNYLIDKALGNIKDDPGSVRSRPRRVPVSELTIKDKDSIPKMPEKILREPKDEVYKKKIADLKAQNNAKKASIEEYIEKRKQETMGVKSDDKENVFQKMKKINEEIKALSLQIKNEEEPLAPLRKKFAALSDKVKSYEKYHFSTNLKKVNQEIKKIKEKLSFGAINVSEENDLVQRKSILEEYEKTLKTFLDFKKENNETLNKTKEPKQKRKALYEQRDKLDKEIKELKAKKELKKPEIENINKIIESLKEDKRKINEEIRQVYKDWDNEWYEYNEQQKLISYINKANDKIKVLEKKEKEEKAKKKEEGEIKGETKDSLQIIKYKPTEKDLKIEQYNDLKNYFIALLPKEEQEKKLQEAKGAINIDISKNAKPGKLQKIEKKVDELFGAEKGGRKGKKGKKPKEPKGSRKAAKNVGLSLDFEMIQKISEAGLSAPTKIEDIPAFLEELEKKKTKYEKGESVESEPKKEEPKKEVKKEEPKKEEPKKEEPKKEQKKEQKNI